VIGCKLSVVVSMGKRRWLAALVASLFLVGMGGHPARADVVAWDQAKVREIAAQLVRSTQDLYDTFYMEPVAAVGSVQFGDYYRLKHVIRSMKTEAAELAEELGRGSGRDETLPSYESLMELVRKGRELAARNPATESLKQKASNVRQLLNQLGPYYDPDFQTLPSVLVH